MTFIPPDYDPFDGGTQVHGDIRGSLTYEDAFENIVTNRTNVLLLAAHYPYSPERWRVFVNGSRTFPEYNSVSQYNHTGDRHELKPAAGETVVFESAERPRYIVQYELAATFAFEINQSLSGDDAIRIGPYDGSDGWYLEHNGGHPDDQTGDVVMERAGSEVYRETDVDLFQPVTKFARAKVKTGWYDLTRQEWERSYPTADGEQKNPVIATKGAPDSQGPQVGNLPIHFEVEADASTTGLVLDAGSAAQVNLGTTNEFARTKRSITTQTIGTTDTWVPLLAVRVDPDRYIVNTQLTQLKVMEYSSNDDVELLAISCDPSNVLDSGGDELVDADYSTPNEHSNRNSVIEKSAAVEQFPDSTGTTTTSATDPGGYQVGHASLFTSSGNSAVGENESPSITKRPIYGRDVAVILGKSASTGDVTFRHSTAQDW